jgi:hypothetical protein
MAWWASKSRPVKVLTVAVATAAAVTAAQVGLSVGVAGAHVDGFRVRVTTDKQVYKDGDAVEATLRVCRTGLMPTTTTGGGGTNLPVEFRILDSEDNVVADSSHGVRTLELRTVRWLPGQCRSAHLRWDQHYWNRPGVDPPTDVVGMPSRGQTVPAGQYGFEVTWKGAVGTRTFEIEARGDTQ